MFLGYSFFTFKRSAGVTIFELVTLKRPFVAVPGKTEIQKLIWNSPVPELAAETPQHLKILIQMCV